MDLALQGIHRLLEVRELVKEGRYAYSGSFNAPTWVKGDVLAAFPFKVNGYRMTCVVNEEVFNTFEGIVLARAYIRLSVR